MQLTISGCIGPRGVINSEAGSQWLANVTEFHQYRSLVEWAARFVGTGRVLELPQGFKAHRIEPWR